MCVCAQVCVCVRVCVCVSHPPPRGNWHCRLCVCVCVRVCVCACLPHLLGGVGVVGGAVLPLHVAVVVPAQVEVVVVAAVGAGPPLRCNRPGEREHTGHNKYHSQSSWGGARGWRSGGAGPLTVEIRLRQNCLIFLAELLFVHTHTRTHTHTHTHPCLDTLHCPDLEERRAPKATFITLTLPI